jgi:hypothetical protein
MFRIRFEYALAISKSGNLISAIKSVFIDY